MMNCDRGFLHNFRVWTVPRVSVEDPRGARHWGASSCHTLVYGRTAWILDHDAVMRICGEAPGGGPILLVGIKCHFEYGVPPPRIVNSAVRRKASASTEQVKGDALPGPSTCRTQDDALQCLASGDKPPKRNDQF